MALTSCDTFVCLPPNTLDNAVIFGKNSDRPQGEVQEIIFQGRKSWKGDDIAPLKCTYIEIEQTEETFAVILSKPSWMWGAEMGANEFGVVIGNEAVWTKLMNGVDEMKKRFLGMDLVRLGLERGKSARLAMDIITNLLEKYGQGGPCAEKMPDFVYHNSFLIADTEEAWVLETVGNQIWAAERIESGFRNISNSLSIGTKIDASSPRLEEESLKLGLWDGSKPFHFAKIFSDHYSEDKHGRFFNGRRLLEEYSKDCKFDLNCMMNILRDEPSCICMGYEDSFPSTSSQVSVLRKDAVNSGDCHWFTGTPDPANSVFKPFVFGRENGIVDSNIELTTSTKSPNISENINRSGSGSKHKVNVDEDRRHELYKLQEEFFWKIEVLKRKDKQAFTELTSRQRAIEQRLIKDFESNDMLERKDQYNRKLFNSAVEEEIKFYRK